MTTMNLFNLPSDDDELRTPLLNKPAELPIKPPPPARAVREARTEPARGGRGGGRGGGGGFGRGRGFSRDSPNAGKSSERRGYGPRAPYCGGRGYGPRAPYCGGRRVGFGNGETGEGEEGRPRRAFDRRSGTGRGATDEAVNEAEKNLGDEKPAVEDDVADGNKDSPANETEEKEPEDKSVKSIEFLMSAEGEAIRRRVYETYWRARARDRDRGGFIRRVIFKCFSGLKDIFKCR